MKDKLQQGGLIYRIRHCRHVGLYLSSRLHRNKYIASFQTIQDFWLKLTILTAHFDRIVFRELRVSC